MLFQPMSDDFPWTSPDVPPPEATASAGQQRFQTCRWRMQEPPADYCTHRDVLPFAGTTGFTPDAWCPECRHYKLRRNPRRSWRDEGPTR